MYMSQIAQNLKKARIQAGYTQKEVEAMLGLRDLSMKDYETGRLKLPAEMAARFAELFKVNVGMILSMEDKELNETPQTKQLSEISQLLHRGEIGTLFLDPVIRAQLEEYSDKILDHSVFDLITYSFTEKQKKSLFGEMLKILASLMGADNKISESELSFLNGLIAEMGLTDQGKSISRSITAKHTPDVKYFGHNSAVKHFMIWLLFFLAKSDGKMTHEEVAYIEECAEILKVNRSNYLSIKGYFKGWM